MVIAVAGVITDLKKCAKIAYKIGSSQKLTLWGRR
jgi:hypothetical protein